MQRQEYANRLPTFHERPRPEIRLDFRILADKAVRRSGPSLSALRQDDGVDRLFFFYSGGWFAYMK